MGGALCGSLLLGLTDAEMSTDINSVGADLCHCSFQSQLVHFERRAPVADFIRVMDVDPLLVLGLANVFVVRHGSSLIGFNGQCNYDHWDELRGFQDDIIPNWLES